MERFKNTIGILLTVLLIGLLAFVGKFIHDFIETKGLAILFAAIYSVSATAITFSFMLEYFKFGEDERD